MCDTTGVKYTDKLLSYVVLEYMIKLFRLSQIFIRVIVYDYINMI